MPNESVQRKTQRKLIMRSKKKKYILDSTGSYLFIFKQIYAQYNQRMHLLKQIWYDLKEFVCMCDREREKVLFYRFTFY